MQITNFTISEDRTQINVTIEDAATVSTLLLWTDDTYKDYALAIDLSGKLTASATETFSITLSDIQIAYFDGIYYLEAEDEDELSYAITSDLTRYKECIMEKAIQARVCDECLLEDSIPVINAQGLLIALEDAIDLGFIDEMFLMIQALDKFCNNTCNTCGKYNNILDNSYYSYNG